jgi:hypothetical protein
MPHATHMPPTHAFAALSQRVPPQQGSPAAPQVTIVHVPVRHESPVAQVLPPQHPCPAPPQGEHMPPPHARPAPHALAPAQHG